MSFNPNFLARTLPGALLSPASQTMTDLDRLQKLRDDIVSGIHPIYYVPDEDVLDPQQKSAQRSPALPDSASSLLSDGLKSPPNRGGAVAVALAPPAELSVSKRRRKKTGRAAGRLDSDAVSPIESLVVTAEPPSVLRKAFESPAETLAVSDRLPTPTSQPLADGAVYAAAAAAVDDAPPLPISAPIDTTNATDLPAPRTSDGLALDLADGKLDTLQYGLTSPRAEPENDLPRKAPPSDAPLLPEGAPSGASHDQRMATQTPQGAADGIALDSQMAANKSCDEQTLDISQSKVESERLDSNKSGHAMDAVNSGASRQPGVVSTGQDGGTLDTAEGGNARHKAPVTSMDAQRELEDLADNARKRGGRKNYGLANGNNQRQRPVHRPYRQNSPPRRRRGSSEGTAPPARSLAPIRDNARPLEPTAPYRDTYYDRPPPPMGERLYDATGPLYDPYYEFRGPPPPPPRWDERAFSPAGYGHLPYPAYPPAPLHGPSAYDPPPPFAYEGSVPPYASGRYRAPLRVSDAYPREYLPPLMPMQQDYWSIHPEGRRSRY